MGLDTIRTHGPPRLGTRIVKRIGLMNVIDQFEQSSIQPCRSFVCRLANVFDSILAIVGTLLAGLVAMVTLPFELFEIVYDIHVL